MMLQCRARSAVVASSAVAAAAGSAAALSIAASSVAAAVAASVATVFQFLVSCCCSQPVPTALTARITSSHDLYP